MCVCVRAAVSGAQWSSNVLVEDLHNTRNLETTYYVTDVTQASDFYWDRESGLRVNIGIHGVRLIPEYSDVDHSRRDDSQFILDSPDESHYKNTFRRVVHSYCRSLQLSLILYAVITLGCVCRQTCQYGRRCLTRCYNCDWTSIRRAFHC